MENRIERHNRDINTLNVITKDEELLRKIIFLKENQKKKKQTKNLRRRKHRERKFFFFISLNFPIKRHSRHLFENSLERFSFVFFFFRRAFLKKSFSNMQKFNFKIVLSFFDTQTWRKILCHSSDCLKSARGFPEMALRH